MLSVETPGCVFLGFYGGSSRMRAPVLLYAGGLYPVLSAQEVVRVSVGEIARCDGEFLAFWALCGSVRA